MWEWGSLMHVHEICLPAGWLGGMNRNGIEADFGLYACY
jgi:hypothetical protein